MKGRLNLGIACGVMLAASMCASTAKAQFMSGGGYGLGFFNYGNTGVYMERIPYYALYPPVYYSYPVARTYGYSPFAYPPGTMTPQSAPAAAAMFRNPYVKPQQPVAAEAVDKSVDRGRRGPVRIAQTYINPFVTPGATASSGALTARLGE